MSPVAGAGSSADGRVPRARWVVRGLLLFLHAFANVSVLRKGAVIVLLETSNYQARAKTFAAVRAIDSAPLHAAIYTHGHADHACGLPPFLDEAREQGRPRPTIVAT